MHIKLWWWVPVYLRGSATPALTQGRPAVPANQVVARRELALTRELGGGCTRQIEGERLGGPRPRLGLGLLLGLVLAAGGALVIEQWDGRVWRGGGRRAALAGSLSVGSVRAEEQGGERREEP